ncbi:MAG TPA: M28 family peptidase [Gaiellaceae bacterium]|nr:M28 family peptidase [Gaiellaceae bacterium]
MAADLPRRRPRRGSLERPVSTRIYRAAWLVVAVPLLVAAFSVGRPDALPDPRLRPFFDEATAVQFGRELSTRFPDRTPGSEDARGAADWVELQLREYRFEVERQTFSAEIPGRGREELVNLVALAPSSTRADVQSPRAIVVLAHRDNLGVSPGASDNGSGTGALLELARDLGNATLAHPFVLVSTDGGAFGGLGAARFAEDSPYEGRIAAVVNLDSLGGPGRARVEFGGDTARVPSPTLLATADAAVERQTGGEPDRPGALAQLVDLAFPFNLYEQAPFVSRGVPALTITTGTGRPPPPAGDTLASLDRRSIGELGRAAQALLGSLDEAAEVTRGTQSYLYFGTRLLHGWTIQFVLVAALVPFLAATVDLFARCRRRRIALRPALRSYLSRLGVWLWLGAVFALFVAVGLLPSGADRPIAPDTPAAQGWPVAAVAVLLAVSALAWLVARPRLAPTRSISRPEELGGHLAAMLVLAVVALVVAAVNPYALLFVLPSLHAWLWLPQISDRGRAAQAAVYALGLAGPAILLASFGLRYEMGLDAIWYLAALTAVGYVPVPLVLAFLAWGAAAGQVGAVAFGRYAPYPDVTERSRGPVREAARQGILVWRRSRRRHLAAVDAGEDVHEAESAES